jgi:hypothetical protein
MFGGMIAFGIMAQFHRLQTLHGRPKSIVTVDPCSSLNIAGLSSSTSCSIATVIRELVSGTPSTV